jgi:hypothetical protein
MRSKVRVFDGTSANFTSFTLVVHDAPEEATGPSRRGPKFPLGPMLETFTVYPVKFGFDQLCS